MEKAMQSRREFLKRSAALGLASAGAVTLYRCGSAASLSGSKLNIIFILTDDMSYHALSSYGQEHYRTPNMDRLALNSIRFQNGYSGSPECAPSRASLMTGMHMGHCRIRKNLSLRGQEHLLQEDVTVAEILKSAGYATGFVGKWGIGLPGTEGVPYKKGFDYAYGFYDQRRAHTYYPDYIMENEKEIILSENHGFNLKRLYEYGWSPVGKEGHVANRYDEQGRLIADGVADPAKAVNAEDLYQEAALSFIRQKKNESFFLYYATQIPHGPLITPHLGEFKDKDWSIRHKELAAMKVHLDRGVGRMMHLLEELGILENTIIFFASDNGYSQWGNFGRERWKDDPLFKNKGPWRDGKTTCKEGGVRVPFFAYCPKFIPARESHHICALYDFPATAADIAGVKLAQVNDGISLVPEMENRSRQQQKHEYLYWEKIHEQAVRMGQWRAYRTHPTEQTELYDIERDPASENNIAAEHPDIIAEIEQIFREAHVDSEWYINPGENQESISAKREKAEKESDVPASRRGNTTYTDWDGVIDRSQYIRNR